MKFASKNSLDIGHETPDLTRWDLLPEKDRFAAFLAQWMKPAVKADFARYYENDNDPAYLPDNSFYRRQVHRMGEHLGYPMLRVLEQVAFRANHVNPPARVASAIARLRDDSTFGGKGQFQRAGDIIDFHDFMVDHLDDYAPYIEKIEAELLS